MLAKVPEAGLPKDTSQREINVRTRLPTLLSRHYETGRVQKHQIPRAAWCMLPKEEVRYRKFGVRKGRTR